MEPGTTRVEVERGAKVAAGPRRRLFGSPIRRRVLAINLLALLFLFGGVFYLDDYESRLMEAELASLRRQGEIVAATLGEAVAAPETEQVFDPDLVRAIFARIAQHTPLRLRLFSPSGALVADSFAAGRGHVLVERLAPPRFSRSLVDPLVRAYEYAVDWVPRRSGLALYREARVQRADHYAEVVRALQGEHARAVRGAGGRGTVLSAAVPVQHYRRVVGAVFVTADGRAVEQGLRAVREDILRVFAVALAVTVMLSVYLARTIARPIRLLARAADRVRHGLGRRHAVPEFHAARRDEIGDLAGALKDMTETLWRRLDAVERFAADVAHEIRNPLSSLHSAVETAVRVKDPEQQRRLMAIIVDDVARLDRLIRDISDASRLDAELSREETSPVDLRRLLATLVEVDRETRVGGPRLALDCDGRADLVVPGIEDRLGQVFRNLIANAISFTPEGGTIRLAARRTGQAVEIAVEDEGPGIPEGKFEAIFKRFYSERPSAEKFGIHSGLGLSISKQIVEAHAGAIRAENRAGPGGRVLGARFVVTLPR